MRRIQKYQDMDCESVAKEIYFFIKFLPIVRRGLGFKEENEEEDIKLLADWLGGDVEE